MESIWEINRETQQDDDRSNKLKYPSKSFKLSHLNKQSTTSSLDEFQVMLKEHPFGVNTRDMVEKQ